MTSKIFLSLLVLLFAGWLVLFFSSSGILVRSNVPSEKDLLSKHTLECTYFTGTGFVTKRSLRTDLPHVGSLVCPRTVKL